MIGRETILPGALRHFKRYQTCMVTFFTLYCMGFQWILGVRGGGNDETVSTGCGSPSVLHPWMLLLHMQETALWIPPVCCVLDDICKRQFCGFPGGLLSSRGGGPDTLAPVLQFLPLACLGHSQASLQCHFSRCKVVLCLEEDVLCQVHRVDQGCVPCS